MSDDVEDPRLLAEAEAEIHAGEGLGASATARPRWVGWTVGLLIVSAVVLVAKSLVENHHLRMSSVAGVYDYEVEHAERPDTHMDHAGASAVLELDQDGQFRITLTEPRIGRGDELAEYSAAGHWVVRGDRVMFTRFSMSGASGHMGAFTPLWRIGREGGRIVLYELPEMTGPSARYVRR